MVDNMEMLLEMLMAVGGLAFLCGGLFLSRGALLIQLRRGIAHGRIEETRFVRKRTSDSDREAYVRVTFKTADQTPISFEQAAPGGFFTTHEAHSVRALEGRDVQVHYDRKAPSRATITPRRDISAGLAFSLAGIFILAALLFGWTDPSDVF